MGAKFDRSASESACSQRAGYVARLKNSPHRLGAIFATAFFFTATAIGFFIDSNIEARVIENASLTAAHFIEGFLEPLVQSLVLGPSLTNEERASLDKLLINPSFRKNVVNLRIWHPDGTIVYSDERALEGIKYELHEQLRGAFRGEVTTELSEAPQDPVTGKHDFTVPIVEVHAPLRALGTSPVIGAAEFFMDADELSKDLRKARKYSSAFAGLFSILALIAALAVLREIRTRPARRKSVIAKNLLAADILRNQMEQDEKAVAKTSDDRKSKSMGEVMADLHDGPAQLLALALLKLDALGLSSDAPTPKAAIDAVRGVTGDALKEIRNILRKSTNPELENLTLQQVFTFAAQLHEDRTRSSVALNIGSLPAVNSDLSACLFQFTREALNNAFWHAGGKGQSLRAEYDGRQLTVEIRDEGKQFTYRNAQDDRIGFGLLGMADRIKSKGGVLEIYPSSGEGTRLVAKFVIQEDVITALARA
ncbi:sensor histidine kinase [Hyphomicrobium sp. 99]|uniref:sensor histidine kinase n=1 Tax=Hyphomicrobium sp. 99 TaxID=1163419 RepID=UPI0005F7F396|nr:histidine kinase [Hyphomicrobium sp. 99]